VVDRVSFTIGEREIVGLVGESGSGKTLTCLSLIGLVADPNVEITGSVIFKGQELVGASPRLLRRLRGGDIAVIFQDPMTALTPVHTIGSQIAEQIRTHTDLSRRAARTRAVDLLAAVGIADPALVADRYPHQLSGGMRQRAVIAMALSCDPSLLIADEPTTALDVTIQAQILELLENLRGEFGSAVALITHDLGVVGEVADRIMVMYAGRIVEAGPRDDVLLAPEHPYTWGLLRSIPALHGPKPHRLATIGGAPPALADLPQGCAFRPRCAFRREACLMRPPLAGRGAKRVACIIEPEDATVLRADLFPPARDVA
jgi:peptide/nickel transport system ATP-binding protein